MPRPRDLNEKYEVGKSGRKEMNKDYGSIASLINNEVSRHYKRNLNKVSLKKSCGVLFLSNRIRDLDWFWSGVAWVHEFYCTTFYKYFEWNLVYMYILTIVY